MKRVLTKELTIYVVLFVLLALLMHPDLLETPSSRFSLMLERENFYHPLLYSFILYVLLYIFRFISKKIVLLFNKFRNI